MLPLKRSVLLILIILLLLTALLAALHLTTRTPDIEGAILVNGESVRISELKLHRVSGTLVNGKGEAKQIDAQGIALADICGSFSEVKITASDEYFAVVDSNDAKNAFLIEDGGGLRLVVFGDENAKRDVKNVVRIEFG